MFDGKLLKNYFKLFSIIGFSIPWLPIVVTMTPESCWWPISFWPNRRLRLRIKKRMKPLRAWPYTFVDVDHLDAALISPCRGRCNHLNNILIFLFLENIFIGLQKKQHSTTDYCQVLWRFFIHFVHYGQWYWINKRLCLLKYYLLGRWLKVLVFRI